MGNAGAYRRVRLEDCAAHNNLLYGNMSINRLTPTEVFMDLLSIRNICTNVYPQFQEEKPARVMRDFMKATRFDRAIEACATHDFASTTPDSYQALVREVHQALTESELEMHEDHNVDFDTAAVDDLLEGFQQEYDQLSQASN